MSLTPEQIKNWRKVLCVTLGPYALICSDEEIIKIHDSLQTRLNQEEEDRQQRQSVQQDSSETPADNRFARLLKKIVVCRP